jgi:hypothetical protein
MSNQHASIPVASELESSRPAEPPSGFVYTWPNIDMHAFDAPASTASNSSEEEKSTSGKRG